MRQDTVAIMLDNGSTPTRAAIDGVAGQVYEI